MPLTEAPTARAPLAMGWASSETILHALHLYGAAGIAAFGWAVCQLLECAARPWVPLWFCAGVFVYNLDRLRIDPSDRLNTPARAEAAERLRPWSAAAVTLAAAVLLLWPAWRRDWLTLLATALGSATVIFYPLPLGRKRLKDVPLLKTFLPPVFVGGAIFVLPLAHEPGRFHALYAGTAALWAGALLLGNMVLCDLRDVEGDRGAGVLSLPAYLGERRTAALLWALSATALAAGILAGAQSAGLTRLEWGLIAPLGSGYLAGLIVAVRSVRSERFFERWVEGLLYVPAVILLAIRLFT